MAATVSTPIKYLPGNIVGKNPKKAKAPNPPATLILSKLRNAFMNSRAF
jgi:hypothetical protein